MDKVIKKGINTFVFTTCFKLLNQKEWKKSNAFKIENVSDIDFNISVKLDNSEKYIIAAVSKSGDDSRQAVSIIKLTTVNGTVSTQRIFDWKTHVVFNEILLPVSFDACGDDRTESFNIRSCLIGKNWHYYHVTIVCSITWHGFVDDLYFPDMCKHMKNNYKNTEFSDMVIKVKDTEFPAHKNIIANQSPVFYKMLTTKMKESIENSITFEDIDIDIMEELLLFFYQGKLDKAEVDDKVALKLFEFAEMYQIDKLKSTCEFIVIKNLTMYLMFMKQAKITIQ
ncbi:TD and POZ domain-containing protein 3-like [Microplitis mediator]|uniref:TD and POZ domain-containing protein 3-like n=1 Tax=Microplitis mediator TaxID=375433 RepID=UPI00255705CD|nr:TD and POZ domain-containing protein 3-like [Microplitis mediator]